MTLESSTFLQRGPIVSNFGHKGTTPSREISPLVVLSPTKSFHAAGTLTEPPVSDPIPIEARLNATDPAAPEDEPPDTASKLFIQGVVFVIGFKPRPENASSDMWVLPKHTNPALVACCKTTASDCGTLPDNNKVPASVFISLLSNKSFHDIGTPSSKLKRVLFFALTSACSASFNALSEDTLVYISFCNGCFFIAFI